MPGLRQRHRLRISPPRTSEPLPVQCLACLVPFTLLIFLDPVLPLLLVMNNWLGLAR